MYKFPKNFNPDLLLNLEVEMVCFNLTQIYVHLGLKTFITIEGKYQINLSDVIDIHENKSESYFIKLIKHTIKNIEIDPQTSNLSIHFTNNTVLTLINDTHYESFKLTMPDQQIII